ncbi:hypothetical protein ERJ75_001002600 [Trypanosoma vivax]|uniref:Uncharacterized protein n=1 Tax=Trypanosoma vivax (strain Y486) TaxID=1055687 RepID=G0UAZ5_TRYVY|nr:hypothetical protein ERJ75_001002600 [Trypanosoma vivax]CCC52982.1 conserved hypothetical protein [Trypanosoma vivax Y486]
MYQPLLELAPSSTSTLVGERLVGEAAGFLWGEGNTHNFESLGGAVYPSWYPANKNVIGKGRWLAAAGASTASWRQRPWRTLQRILRPVTALFPLLRTVLPAIVPKPAIDCIQGSYPLSKANPERITTISFHSVRMVLAAAVEEGGGSCRVIVYDVAEEKEVCVLTHAFQRNVHCIKWKPFSRDVLAVGCTGGVLLWCLSFGLPLMTHQRYTSAAGSFDSVSDHTGTESCVRTSGNSRAYCNNSDVGFSTSSGEDRGAYCLFYRCDAGIDITCMNFSCRDGRYLACGSREHAALHFHDIRLQPTKSLLLRSISIEGGTQDVLFSEDDSFAMRLISGVAMLLMTQFPSCTSTAVPTAAPVLKVARARALGPNHFFMQCARTEGVFVTHVNPFVGVHVIALISTGVHRGVGGAVHCIASSGRRLYIAVETGHLLVLRYGRRGVFTLIPVGTAELRAEQMAVFDGYTCGSLLAIVEADQAVVFFPSYHT